MSDRTQEFSQLCVQISRTAAVVPRKVLEGPKTKSAFNEATSEIARGIHKTSLTLAQLSQLIKRQGLFDDPTEEINNFIFRIKQDLDELNTKCDSAQQYIEAKKTIFGGKTEANQSAKHNVSVVSHLKTDLMNATKNFKTALEERQSKMKNQQVRKAELAGKGNLSPMRIMQEANKAAAKSNGHNSFESLNGNGSKNNSIVALRKQKSGGLNFQSPYGQLPDLYGNNANSTHITQGEERQQQTQFLLAPINNQYFDQREKAVTEVEKTIGELGTLFTRLSTMISAQGEMVERIDEDIESANENANNAKKVLEDMLEKVSGNKMMYLKIAGILAIFFLLFIIFLL
jgi:syntaxin 5